MVKGQDRSLGPGVLVGSGAPGESSVAVGVGVMGVAVGVGVNVGRGVFVGDAVGVAVGGGVGVGLGTMSGANWLNSSYWAIDIPCGSLHPLSAMRLAN